jgi:hypothetical protein
MARLTRFSIAKDDIVTFFKTHPQKVLKVDDLAGIFEENRKEWRLAKSMSLDAFIEELIHKTPLKKVSLIYSNGPITLFLYGDISPYALAVKLKPKAYISHYTAIYFHKLTEQLPKAIYITFEQSMKHVNREPLLQENINKAFAKPQRVSENNSTYDGYTIHLLNGMYTGHEGVETIEDIHAGIVPITSLERTLIDSAVRPAYSGGPGEVLKAFENAKEKVSINKLNAMLNKLNFAYPYHQVIGFYLEKAGYRESQINLLRKKDIQYDFYLTYNMGEMEYSPTWKLYYPKGF